MFIKSIWCDSPEFEYNSFFKSSPFLIITWGKKKSRNVHVIDRMSRGIKMSCNFDVSVVLVVFGEMFFVFDGPEVFAKTVVELAAGLADV